MTSSVPPTATDNGSWITGDGPVGPMTGVVEPPPFVLVEPALAVVVVVCVDELTGPAAGDWGSLIAAVRWWAAAYLG